MASEQALEAPVKAIDGVHFEDLPRRLRDHGRPVDEETLRRAWEFARDKHEGQTRKSGEPYVLHPLTVAYLLADLKFDETCVTVGLLHDVLEDTGTSRETLREQFGGEVTELVDGVSKIGRHSYVRRDEAQAETFRKLILASAKDIRVIVVKLIDRLHNMQTLEHMKPEARRRISRETLEIYSPLAHRLGMSKVQGELEDLAFFYLYPHQFAELKTRLDEKIKLGEGATQRIRDQLVRDLEEAQIDCEISYRVKRYYSIYRKLRRQRIDIAELYDYLAFRVITETTKDTYAALGVVHQNWRPIPGRFKDYIAMPKPNLYQSLHTTVVGERAQPFEVQIRTRKMDLVAEEGIAAHWRYKEGKLEPQESDRNIAWLRRLLDWQKEVSDPRTFLSSLKIDLYPDEVYVFSPKGEVMAFPRGATPLDFAYRVHTDLGHHCSGARVSGRLVPLRTELSNGDIVEILTNPNREPSQDWLKIVVTPRAKSKIRHWLNTQQKERAVEIGQELGPGAGTASLSTARPSSDTAGHATRHARATSVDEGASPTTTICWQSDRFRQDATRARSVTQKVLAEEERLENRHRTIRDGCGKCGQTGSTSVRVTSTDDRAGPGRIMMAYPRQVLQSAAGRRHRRLRHAGPWGLRALGRSVRTCKQPDVQPGTRDRGRLGAAATRATTTITST